MSMRTRLGACTPASSIACAPVVASSVRKPAAVSTSRTSFMFLALSSTTRTSSPDMGGVARCQREHEPAPRPGLALDPDPAAVELDEPLRQGEPEPGSL